VNPSVRVFIVTGAFDDLGQAVTACMLAPGAKLAHVSKRAGPPLEHRAGALLYAAVDLSQKDAAAEVVERAFKEAGRKDGLVNLACWFHRDKLEGIEDSPMWRDVLVQRAPQSNISDAGPLVLMVARRCIEERRKARIRTSFFQWNYESPWLALNQCIAQEEWTTPTHSWMAQHR
jgi:short chain dehydrogenase